jgi:hypothetical protein
MSGDLSKPGTVAGEMLDKLKDPASPSGLVKKVLESGLVDKATAELMEVWGYLPDGAADLVKEDALKDATHEKVAALAKDLADELEKEHHLRETYLDLERLRWPASVCIYKPDDTLIISGAVGLMDRMGRYYFRIQDVDQAWFVPGYDLLRQTPKGMVKEHIFQSQVLYLGRVGICVQVSTDQP